MRMSRFLASVCSSDEARLAVEGYADIIDCKNPRQGALGALPPETIVDIVKAVDNQRPISATIGNDIPTARTLRDAIQVTTDCGVDYVKFGLFDADAARTYAPVLRQVESQHALIAVCFADLYDPGPLLRELADNGVRGVMIDTANKHAGSLTSLWSRRRIGALVSETHRLGLLCGLAGRLHLDDVATLLPFHADYLGFRSALCAGDRSGRLDHAAIMRIRDAIPFARGTATIAQTGTAVH
jgi:dihydroneopterin aldolase